MALLSASSRTSTSRSSVRLRRHRAAPPKPHLGHQAGGAGSRSASALGIDDTLPLQLRLNASPFWIILLLSVGALEHAMIKQAGLGQRQQDALSRDWHKADVSRWDRACPLSGAKRTCREGRSVSI